MLALRSRNESALVRGRLPIETVRRGLDVDVARLVRIVSAAAVLERHRVPPRRQANDCRHSRALVAVMYGNVEDFRPPRLAPIGAGHVSEDLIEPANRRALVGEVTHQLAVCGNGERWLPDAQ